MFARLYTHCVHARGFISYTHHIQSQLLEKKFHSRSSDVKAVRNMLYIVSEVGLAWALLMEPFDGTVKFTVGTAACARSFMTAVSHTDTHARTHTHPHIHTHTHTHTDHPAQRQAAGDKGPLQ